MKSSSVLGGLALALAVLPCFGFRAVPKESATALGVTRGKPFSSGVVFVNGKYVIPPYVVERWGTGLRINGNSVSGQVIDWNEFLKTQDGVKVVAVTSAPPEQAVQAQAETAKVTVVTAAAVAAEGASSLDDLFNDNGKPQEKAEESKLEEKAADAKPEPVRPKTRTAYELTGEFKPNDESKALLKRINASRTEIDRMLRAGGFACFGDNYAMVAGDQRSLLKLLQVLPGLLEKSNDLDEFQAGVRRAGLVFLSEPLCADLYRNRADHPRLKKRYERLHMNQKWDKFVERTSNPLF